MRIEPAAGGGHQIDGNRFARVAAGFAQRLDALLHGVVLRGIERSLVRSARRAGVVGNGDVAEGRVQKYFASQNGWPISSEPTSLPSCFQQAAVRLMRKDGLRDTASRRAGRRRR